MLIKSSHVARMSAGLLSGNCRRRRCYRLYEISRADRECHYTAKLINPFTDWIEPPLQDFECQG